MALTLNTNHSSIEQLQDINRMAHSSGLRTTGNIGLIGTQVVKFNTHFSERRASVTTDAMLNSSNALRETLKGLIGNVLSDPADAGLKEKLFAKLDAGGTHALLERKVVAKVLDELGGHAGLEGVRLGKGTPLQSSKGLMTDFATIRAEALDAGRRACEWEMKSTIMHLAKDFASTLRENGFKTDNSGYSPLDRFNRMATGFAEEYARLNVDMNQLHKPVPQDKILDMFALLARAADDGRSFPITKDTSPTVLRNVNQPMVDCFANLASRKPTGDVGRLMAHFEFSTYMDVEFANVILAKTSDLGKGELSRDRIFELMTGEPPARGANLDALSQKDFQTALGDAYQKHLAALCNRPGIKDPETAALNLRAMTTGASGLVLLEETALKVLAPGKDGLHLTMADLKASGPAYNTQELRRKYDLDGMVAWQRQEIPRDRPNFSLKGTYGMRKEYDERVYSFREGMVKPNSTRLNDAGKERFNEFITDFKRLNIDPRQRLVAGVAMSQALMLLSALPVGGACTHPSPDYELRHWETNGELSLGAVYASPDGKGPSLKVSYNIRPDGESTLVSLDYTVPPQEEERPAAQTAPAPEQAPKPAAQQAQATEQPHAPASSANQKLKQAAADAFVEEALGVITEQGFSKQAFQPALNKLMKVGQNVGAFGNDVDFIKIGQMNGTCKAAFEMAVGRIGRGEDPEQAMRRAAQNLQPRNSYTDYLAGAFNQLADKLHELQAMNA